jgi:hypothetical protein
MISLRSAATWRPAYHLQRFPHHLPPLIANQGRILLIDLLTEANLDFLDLIGSLLPSALLADALAAFLELLEVDLLVLRLLLVISAATSRGIRLVQLSHRLTPSFGLFVKALLAVGRRRGLALGEHRGSAHVHRLILLQKLLNVTHISLNGRRRLSLLLRFLLLSQISVGIRNFIIVNQIYAGFLGVS